ncbi:MAG: hypothetical protein K2P48_08385 [Lachnospiraceae bacterium]|nr:hypothetical protein [Lachnospiraceae bacterium]
MNIGMHGFGSSVFGSGMLFGGSGLKSTQQKMERQEERDRQVAFFENQKENLKNIKCETVEEIARKLEMFHSYEDQIKAAKAAYNNEQMMHMMDESQEIGEKIAEAVEKSKPKTPEERMEDLVEEVTGTESGGILEELDEVMEEALELQEEMQDVLQEEMQPDDLQAVTENLPETDEVQEALEEVPSSAAEFESEAVQHPEAEFAPEDIRRPGEEVTAEELQKAAALYRPFDIKV